MLPICLFAAGPCTDGQHCRETAHHVYCIQCTLTAQEEERLEKLEKLTDSRQQHISATAGSLDSVEPQLHFSADDVPESAKPPAAPKQSRPKLKRSKSTKKRRRWPLDRLRLEVCSSTNASPRSNCHPMNLVSIVSYVCAGVIACFYNAQLGIVRFDMVA